MAIEIKNGTTVHRIWGSLKDAELLGVFQYHLGAKAVCEALISHQPTGIGIVLCAVDHYSGEMTLFPVDKKETEKANA